MTVVAEGRGGYDNFLQWQWSFAASLDSPIHKWFLCSLPFCFESILPTTGVSLLKPCYPFINSVLCCHLRIVSASSPVDSISRNHFLCSPTRRTSQPWKLNHEIAAILSHLQAPLLALLLFPLHQQLLLPLSHELSGNHPWGLEPASSKFLPMLILWPVPMNHNCSQWHLECRILSRKFSMDFAQIHQRNHYIG